MLAVIKILVSALVIWTVSELGKRSGKVGGLILSLPLTSMIALTWLWLETRDPGKVAAVSTETLIFVLPSLVFFLMLSFLLHRTSSFAISFVGAAVTTVGAYAGFFRLTS